MQDPSSAEAPFPAGWLSDFITRADLEASFGALEGYQHFYAEGLRGRIRSLQLKLKEAQRHFARAEALAEKAAKTASNLLREFLLAVYSFECVLLSGPLDPGLGATEAFIPDVPAKVRQEHPEVHLVFNYRKAAEGLFRLHVKDHARALALFDQLVEENPLGAQEQVAMYHIGRACAQHNLGLEDLALRSLECSGLCLQASTKTLPQAQFSGILVGAYAFLGHAEEARTWELFLRQLACPQATKDVCLRRGQLGIQRSIEVSSLVFF